MKLIVSEPATISVDRKEHALKQGDEILLVESGGLLLDSDAMLLLNHDHYMLEAGDRVLINDRTLLEMAFIPGTPRRQPIIAMVQALEKWGKRWDISKNYFARIWTDVNGIPMPKTPEEWIILFKQSRIPQMFKDHLRLLTLSQIGGPEGSLPDEDVFEYDDEDDSPGGSPDEDEEEELEAEREAEQQKLHRMDPLPGAEDEPAPGTPGALPAGAVPPPPPQAPPAAPKPKPKRRRYRGS